MKKTADIGLSHIQKLGIRATKSANGIRDAIVQHYGIVKGTELFQELQKKASGVQTDYDYKNRDYEFSMVFSGTYDADIIRNACNWVAWHRDAFGNEILEIGCDCGFMTTFLGSLFPDKHITSIDIHQSGIDIAAKNVEKFGLTNVSFECISAQELAATGRKFDTVFSMRTLTENFQDLPEDTKFVLPSVAGDIFRRGFFDYAKVLRALLTNEGNLISIERLDGEYRLLGWQLALDEAGFLPDLDSYKELSCMEIGETNTFQASVYTIGSSDYEPYERWLDMVRYDCDQEEYYGYTANVKLELEAAGIIEAYYIKQKDGTVVGKFGVYKWLYEGACMMYKNNGDTEWLGMFDIKYVDELIEELHQIVKHNEGLGFVAEPLD